MFFFQMSHFCFQRTFERKDSRPLTCPAFFETRGSPDAPWVTSAEYRRVLRDSKRPVLNEWFTVFFVAFFVPVFNDLTLMKIKDVHFFPDQTCMYLRHDRFWKQLLLSRFFVDEIHLVPASHRLHSPSMILFVLPHKPSSCPKMLSLKKTKPINHVFFFSRKHGHTTSPSFFRWADLLSAS